MTTKRLREVMRILRKHCPPPRPVVVVRRPISSTRARGMKVTECGYAVDCHSHYRIVLNSKLHEAAQEETLLHEYAHIIAHPRQHPLSKMGHDREWGIAYAEVWRGFLKPLAEIGEEYVS